SLLPAFGSFTGMMEVGADPGRRLFVAGDDGVWQVA
ncbi:MAG TPA: DEAD/DEAH box helicase, partial [Pseudomonas sp.]|nr:DEAD/DEAH box helicase [Pseudomonas sp.]